jgi:para-nitrobenzyl esterase
VVAAFGAVMGSEDCLTLNIWRPSTNDEQLPVIVFVHGGANVAGYSGDPLYHGARLAARTNALVVTMNYRLGVLGWFPSPALDPAAGNAGLLDVVSALRFVRSNAAAFGGDPGNVTLIGQSAGAVNALAITTMQLGDALFRRVFSMSGALVSMTTAARQPYVDRVTDRLLVAEGVARDAIEAARLRNERGNAWLGTWLLARPVESLLRAADGVPGGGVPAADGSILSVDPAASVREGRFLRVPMLFSRTSEEGKFFLTDVYRVSEAERLRMVLGVAGDAGTAAPTVATILKPEFATEAAFNSAVERLGKAEEQFMDMTVGLFASAGAEHTSVVFDWKGQREPWRTLVGSTHGVDLPFLFGAFGPSIYAGSHHVAPRAEMDALSGEFAAALATWVRGGALSAFSLWRRSAK